MNLIQRIWNWCRRFRHRRGYGVHSPSDFYLVTSVIYERLPYYAFRPLKERRFEKGRPHYRRKVNELLFRLVNHLAPKTLLEVGTGDGSSIAYMQKNFIKHKKRCMVHTAISLLPIHFMKAVTQAICH